MEFLRTSDILSTLLNCNHFPSFSTGYPSAMPETVNCPPPFNIVTLSEIMFKTH